MSMTLDVPETWDEPHRSMHEDGATRDYYDKDEVKAATVGRTHELVTRVAGIDDDYLTTRHGPCPHPHCKGGDPGTSRFRVFNDFEQTTGVVCNQCGKFADIFAVVMWMLDISFLDAVEKIAVYLGVPPKSTARNRQSERKQTAVPSAVQSAPHRPKHEHKPAAQKKLNPSDFIEPMTHGEQLMRLYCLKNPPITPEGIERLGGFVARYKGRHTVIAFPIVGESLDRNQATGYFVESATGSMLPKYARGKDGKYRLVDRVKHEVTPGTKSGIIPTTAFLEAARSGQGLANRTALKPEGPKDVAAAASISGDVLAMTNSCGAGEQVKPWIMKLFSGADALVIHDADEPGQAGATIVEQSDGRQRPGWAPMLASAARSCRNVQLPYPVEKTKGKDLRDWTHEQLRSGFSQEETYQKLMQMAWASPVVEPATPEQVAAATKRAEESESSDVATGDEDRDREPKLTDFLDDLDELEDPHDPARLARLNRDRYESQYGGRLHLWRGQWWRYRTGRWSRLDEETLKAKVRHAINQELFNIAEAMQEIADAKAREDGGKQGKQIKKRCSSNALVANVIGELASLCRLSDRVEMPCLLSDPLSRHSFVSLENGILDLDRVIAGEPIGDAFIDHTPYWFSGTQLEYAYQPNAECPGFHEYLTQALPDEDSQKLVQEWAGYLLIPGNPFQAFFVAEGDGGTGKSVLASGVLPALIGTSNVSNVKLDGFGGNQFSLNDTIGKALNVDADVNEHAKFNEGLFKQFATGERVQFEPKGKEPFSIEPTAKVVLVWNTRPRIKDKTLGLWRRMLLVGFDQRVSDDDKIPFMDKPWYWRDTGELPGIFLWAIGGLKRLFGQNGFTDSPVMRKRIAAYRTDQDPVRQFFEDVVAYDETKAVSGQPGYQVTQVSSIVAAYKHWAADNTNARDAEAMSADKMGRAIKKRFGIESIRFYVGTAKKKKQVRGFAGICLIDLEESDHTGTPEDQPAGHPQQSGSDSKAPLFDSVSIDQATETDHLCPRCGKKLVIQADPVQGWQNLDCVTPGCGHVEPVKVAEVSK